MAYRLLPPLSMAHTAKAKTSGRGCRTSLGFLGSFIPRCGNRYSSVREPGDANLALRVERLVCAANHGKLRKARYRFGSLSYA